jgi:hypothetical protein
MRPEPRSEPLGLTETSGRHRAMAMVVVAVLVAVEMTGRLPVAAAASIP